ncbi:hypothetical protein EXIGLDRAFT_198148 [Exidia glandulosa HHB12029]|uniref:Protein kinase domain-containing protein n=1 Tax=Exidia glandulosa HHB12029 TaxID=1314781 RepID=A0A165MWN7_EXIGL|nr:hypothetical protein EXIGLDRAFT_198148 [Exidia glandulosa HHB12029]
MSAGTNRKRPASSTPSMDITHQIRDVSYRPVGHGGYSDIYTGVWSSQTGELKIQKIQRRLKRELRVWRGLSHRNVQRFIGIYKGIGPLPALVSPWCANGNIKSFILRQLSDPSVGPAKLDNIKLNLVRLV